MLIRGFLTAWAMFFGIFTSYEGAITHMGVEGKVPWFSGADLRAPPKIKNADDLQIAIGIVNKLAPDRDAFLRDMTGPLENRAETLLDVLPAHTAITVNEIIVPIYRKHWDEFVVAMARSYALSLSTDDLKALEGFYNTIPGKRIAAAQAAIAVAQTSEVTYWMASLDPEVRKNLVAFHEKNHFDLLKR